MSFRPMHTRENSDLSSVSMTPYGGAPPATESRGANEDTPLSPAGFPPPDPLRTPKKLQPRTKGILWLTSALALLAAIIIAVSVGVTRSHKNDGNANALAAGAGASDSAQPSTQAATQTTTEAPAPSPTLKAAAVISGKEGSSVKLGNGTEVTYVNGFGGDWLWDDEDPWGKKEGALGGGRAQEWSKRSGEDWVWGVDRVRGVNLGGWLVLEPFICPGIFEDWRASTGKPIVDEWTLSEAMGADLEKAMTEHYDTFITEQDFIEIAAAGLNWIRIPIGYWAIETVEGEAFLPKVSWTYFLKAIEWARKYGLRINMDLHALPGSQNGWNHSGRLGTINMMDHVMGLANAERSFSYMQTLAAFVSQPEIAPVVPMFGIVNEIRWDLLDEVTVKTFYTEAFRNIRETTGLGAGKGPYLAYHDGFQGTKKWSGFLEGGDRFVLDQHPYMAFDKNFFTQTLADLVDNPCTWAGNFNRSRTETGVTIGGEFGGATNDCGFWINGIRPNGGSESIYTCADWDDYRKWDDTKKANVKQVVMSTMDAIGDFFFWTWKIGVSKTRGFASSPEWHYQLGMKEGWIPTDPREAVGICTAQAGTAVFDGTFPPSATGKGDGVIDAAQLALYPWPPAKLVHAAGPAANLPRYTATGPMPTLPGPTIVAGTATATVGSGWGDKQARAFVPISGCAYPDEYGGNTAVPAGLATCTGGAAAATAATSVRRTRSTAVATDTVSLAGDRRPWPTAPPMKRAERRPR